MESRPTNSCSTSCPTCGAWWRLPLLLGLVLAAILLSRGRGLWEGRQNAGDGAAREAAEGANRKTVSLAIDYGDGRREVYPSLDWHEGMMVAELFGRASGIAVTLKGAGQGAFLTAIDGVANEGAEGKNWMYEVNEKSGDRSFAVYELRPGDRVLWTFGKQR
jgi:Domain of unknown function (DUF4430)